MSADRGNCWARRRSTSGPLAGSRRVSIEFPRAFLRRPHRCAVIAERQRRREGPRVYLSAMPGCAVSDRPRPLLRNDDIQTPITEESATLQLDEGPRHRPRHHRLVKRAHHRLFGSLTNQRRFEARTIEVPLIRCPSTGHSGQLITRQAVQTRPPRREYSPPDYPLLRPSDATHRCVCTGQGISSPSAATNDGRIAGSRRRVLMTLKTVDRRARAEHGSNS